MGLLFLSNIAQSEALQKIKCNVDLMWVLVSVVSVKLSLFWEEISASTAVHTRHVMDACDRVRPIILLPPMMGMCFLC